MTVDKGYLNIGLPQIPCCFQATEAADQPRSLSSSRVWTPQLRLSNTGEMTPGLIVLRAREHSLERFIQVELTGHIEVLSERP